MNIPIMFHYDIVICSVSLCPCNILSESHSSLPPTHILPVFTIISHEMKVKSSH